ncbi:MAG: HAMP domain-containing histidine kinase [Clostridiales Family XIII bacterium]|jgi:signal transduction histidine kinase|nr:HAMP domain-containing histidine kinase [Clostridiales Family XIII bacterium]
MGAGIVFVVIAIILAAALAAFLAMDARRRKRIKLLSEYIRALESGSGAPYAPQLSNAEGALPILENDILSFAAHASSRAANLEREKNRQADVISDISHQLKTPLTSISVMADLLERDDLPAGKRTEYTRNLRTGISRMQFLTRALLKLARLDADAADLKPVEVEVAKLVERAARPLDVLLDVKDQRIDTEGMAPVTIHCDPAWTAEALGNILKNAGEHSPEGSVICIASGENPICKWISVTDSGAGISAADMPHLFKRFFRSENAAEGSVGIGLAMSLAIMRRQGGDIEAKNERGGGASFTLKFYRR